MGRNESNSSSNSTTFSSNYHNFVMSSSTYPEERVAFSDELNRLVADRQWDEAERRLANCCAIEVSRFLTCENELLHHACSNNAPLYILQSLSKVYKFSASTSNSSGRYPLHEAAKSGAHPDVIGYLCQLNRGAAGKQDDLGRTPMHYAAKYYAKQYRSRHVVGGKMAIVEANECMLRVVKILQEAAPHSFNLEDRDGKNPIEYAIESEANIDVFRCIHRVCRDELRRRSKETGVSNNTSIRIADLFDRCSIEMKNPTNHTAKTA